MNPLSVYLQYSVSPPYRIQGPIYTPVPNKVSHLKGSKKNSIQSSKCLISVCLACIFDFKSRNMVENWEKWDWCNQSTLWAVSPLLENLWANESWCSMWICQWQRRKQWVVRAPVQARLRVVPHFSSGILERTKLERVSLSPPRVAFSRVGWFSRPLAFRSLYYPWGEMGDYS